MGVVDERADLGTGQRVVTEVVVCGDQAVAEVRVGGGNVMCPSRCMRSRATLQDIVLRPPSGLRQSNAVQTARATA